MNNTESKRQLLNTSEIELIKKRLWIFFFFFWKSNNMKFKMAKLPVLLQLFQKTCILKLRLWTYTLYLPPLATLINKKASDEINRPHRSSEQQYL